MRPTWLLLTLAPVVAAQAPPPCTAAEHRQFDFWLGQWEVSDPAGKAVGENDIEAIAGGCALRENWRGRGGFSGQSLNIWDRDTRRWHQTWVDSSGGRLELTGGLEGRSMVLGSRTPRPDRPGNAERQRITWTPADDGSVRQHWQSSEDDGRTWTTVFDGTYRKRR